MPPACGSCCDRRPPALAEKPGIRSARLVPIARRPIDVAPVPEAPGRITRGRFGRSPLQSSATHFARIDSELTPAPRIGEHVVRDRPCNRRDRARFAQCRSSCRSGLAHPHVRLSHRVPPPHPRASRVDRRPDGRHMGRRIAPRLDRLARTTTHRPSCRPSATPPAHRRETHRANARRRVVSGTLRPPEHAGRARRHRTRIERSSPCVS